MSKLVYVSGPLSQGDIITNTRAAIDKADKLALLGYVPVIPHLTISWHMVHPHDYEFWMNLDFAMLSRCDALLRLEGKSPGGDREVIYATERGIFVGYSVSEVHKHFLEEATGIQQMRLFGKESTVGV